MWFPWPLSHEIPNHWLTQLQTYVVLGGDIVGNFEVSKRVHKKRNRAKATPDGVPATEKDWITKRRRVVTLASREAACGAENVGDDMVSMAQSLAASLWTSKHAQEEELQQSRLQEASGHLSFTMSLLN